MARTVASQNHGSVFGIDLMLFAHPNIRSLFVASQLSGLGFHGQDCAGICTGSPCSFEDRPLCLHRDFAIFAFFWAPKLQSRSCQCRRCSIVQEWYQDGFICPLGQPSQQCSPRHCNKLWQWSANWSFCISAVPLKMQNESQYVFQAEGLSVQGTHKDVTFVLQRPFLRQAGQGCEKSICVYVKLINVKHCLSIEFWLCVSFMPFVFILSSWFPKFMGDAAMSSWSIERYCVDMRCFVFLYYHDTYRYICCKYESMVVFVNGQPCINMNWYNEVSTQPHTTGWIWKVIIAPIVT